MWCGGTWRAWEGTGGKEQSSAREESERKEENGRETDLAVTRRLGSKDGRFHKKAKSQWGLGGRNSGRCWEKEDVETLTLAEPPSAILGYESLAQIFGPALWGSQSGDAPRTERRAISGGDVGPCKRAPIGSRLHARLATGCVLRRLGPFHFHLLPSRLIMLDKPGVEGRAFRMLVSESPEDEPKFVSPHSPAIPLFRVTQTPTSRLVSWVGRVTQCLVQVPRTCLSSVTKDVGLGPGIAFLRGPWRQKLRIFANPHCTDPLRPILPLVSQQHQHVDTHEPKLWHAARSGRGESCASAKS